MGLRHLSFIPAASGRALVDNTVTAYVNWLSERHGRNTSCQTSQAHRMTSRSPLLTRSRGWLPQLVSAAVKGRSAATTFFPIVRRVPALSHPTTKGTHHAPLHLMAGHRHGRGRSSRRHSRVLAL